MRACSNTLATFALVTLLAAGSVAEAAEPKSPPARPELPAAASPAAAPSAAPSGPVGAKAPATLPAANPWYRFRAQAELGFLAVLSNRVQFGKQGTYFDYQRDGGQDTLAFTVRPSIEVELARQNTFIFLYQPIELQSRVQIGSDLVVDDARFARGTPMQLTYGFPYYRLSYLFDVFDDDRRELAFGASAQIRNATIEFATTDGSVVKSYRDIGFVPLLKARGRYTFSNGFLIGTEIDAIYAPVRGANGSDNEVTGALVDASLKLGLQLPLKSEAFLNVRYITGGATGQSDPEAFSDGKTRNWLQFMTVSLGANISSF